MKSYWIESVKNKKKYDKLKSNIDVDVCIIGGGLTGISTAYKLKNKGLKVILLEKDRIGESTSGNSTAKITSQHGLIYKYLTDLQGIDFAKLYYQANEEAIKNIYETIKKEKIDCDFEFQDAYVFTQKIQESEKIKDEVEIIKKFGGSAELVSGDKIPISKLKNVQNVDNSDDKLDITVNNLSNATMRKENRDINKKVEAMIPINPIIGIKFEKQAQFNPYKYLYSLALICQKAGINIFENTKVIDVNEQDNNYEIITNEGYKVTAKNIILATKYPIINIPGFYFMKMYQSTSYAIGMEVDKKIFDGMYINVEKPTISLRMAKYNDKYLLIVVGFDNKTGEKMDNENVYRYLEEIARNIYPKGKVRYHWNTEDCISLDKIPYIGRFSNIWKNVFVATGFNKWGITSSEIASEIITDMILEKQNDYSRIFKATRLEPIKNMKEFNNMIKESVNGIVIKKVQIPNEEINQIQEEEGKIVEINGNKLGVFKEKGGKIYTIKPICKHLGCALSWNNLDKTWDCPCHGSRYDYKGNLLYGPSIKNLE